MSDIPKFSLQGVFYTKVIKVYDGDTITVAMNPFPGSRYSQMWAFDVRMYGYDSPELRPRRNDPNRDQIKKKAIEARDALRARVLNKYIILECLPTKDKYGRLLAKVYIPKTKIKTHGSRVRGGYEPDGQSINDWMIKHNHGKPYFGGSKS